MKYPVIIVGAGPGGLISALILAQFDVQPLIIEKNTKRSRFTKALSIQPRTLEIIDSLGLLDTCISKGNLIRKNNFHVNGSLIGTLDYAQLSSKCNYLLAITQPELEQIFEDALQEKGIIIQKGVECTNLEQEDEKNFVKVKYLQTGKEDRLEGDYVIAADGGKSTLRSFFLKEKLTYLTHETRYDSNFIMGDFSMEDYPFDRSERNTFFKNKTICALIPMDYPYVRIVAFGLKKSQDSDPLPEEFFLMTKALTKKNLDFSQGKWLSRFYPSRFMLDRFRIGNVFFVGDAAHIMSPIGAQGINLSIEDGYNIGWKLGMVLKKRISLSILDTYQVERMKAAQIILNETNGLHSKLSSSILNFFFMQQLKYMKKPEINRFVLLKQTQFFIDYPATETKSKSKKKNPYAFHSGHRFINVECESPLGTHLFNLLSRDKFTVLLNCISQECIGEKVIKQLREFPKLPEVYSIIGIIENHSLFEKSTYPCCTINKDSELYDRLSKSSFFLVISPDKYVFRSYAVENLQSAIIFMKALAQKETLIESK